MSINIYPIADRPEFVDQVAVWYQAQWGSKYPQRTLADWKKIIFFGPHVPATFIAIDESTAAPHLVGTVALHKQGMKDADPESVWLTALYVEEVSRHKGIGTKLIQAAIAHTQKVGVDKLYLFTYTSGEIYTKQGWCISKKIECAGKITLVMEREVPALQSAALFRSRGVASKDTSSATASGLCYLTPR